MCVFLFFLFFHFCDFRFYTSNKQNALSKKLKVRFYSKLECILENYCSKNVNQSFLRYIENTTGSVRNFAKCRLVFSLTDSEMGFAHVSAGSQVRRPVSYLQITNIFFI